MLKEMPKIGDRVKYIGGFYEDELYFQRMKYPKIGEVFEITGIDEDGDAFYEDSQGEIQYIQNSGGVCHFEYYESVEKSTPQTDRDLIIELAYTVAKLERKVSELEERDLNHGENIVNIRDWIRELDDKAEMLIDDVVMLDERTRPLTDDGAKEFAEGLSDVIEEYVNDRINSDQLTRDQIRRAYD